MSQTKGVRKFAETTTLHGISDVANSTSKFEKAIWVILILGCFAYMVNEVKNVVLEYETEPTSTQFAFTTPKEFPEMLYCPAQWVDPGKLEKLKWDINRFHYIKSFLLATRYGTLDIMRDVTPRVADEDKYFTELGLTLDEVFANISYSVSELLIDVQRTMSGQPTTVYNVSLFMTHRGMCLRIKVGGSSFFDLEAAIATFRVDVRAFPQPAMLHDRDWDLAFFGADGISILPAGDIPINRNMRTTLKLTGTLMHSANVARRPCTTTGTKKGIIYKDIFKCSFLGIAQECTERGKRPAYCSGVWTSSG